MTDSNGQSGVVRPRPSHWLVQLVRLGNVIAAGALIYLLFFILYPDRIAMAAAFGGLLGVTSSLVPFTHRPDRIFSWRRLFVCAAMLDAMAVLLGLVAMFLTAIAAPFVDDPWDFWLSFGLAALVMSFGSIPVVARFSSRPAIPDEAAREPPT